MQGDGHLGDFVHRHQMPVALGEPSQVGLSSPAGFAALTPGINPEALG